MLNTEELHHVTYPDIFLLLMLQGYYRMLDPTCPGGVMWDDHRHGRWSVFPHPLDGSWLICWVDRSKVPDIFNYLVSLPNYTTAWTL